MERCDHTRAAITKMDKPATAPETSQQHAPPATLVVDTVAVNAWAIAGVTVDSVEQSVRAALSGSIQAAFAERLTSDVDLMRRGEHLDARLEALEQREAALEQRAAGLKERERRVLHGEAAMEKMKEAVAPM